jgi:hypothetical protein
MATQITGAMKKILLAALTALTLVFGVGRIASASPYWHGYRGYGYRGYGGYGYGRGYGYRPYYRPYGYGYGYRPYARPFYAPYAVPRAYGYGYPYPVAPPFYAPPPVPYAGFGVGGPGWSFSLGL